MPTKQIPTATGEITHSVYVRCPHCFDLLDLNDYPYNDERTDYSHAEDELGLALFGTDKNPAQWSGLAIEYTCCGCKKAFQLAGLGI